jgi:hypothetical protein
MMRRLGALSTLGAVVLLALAGCSAASAPASTVTVTASPTVPTLKAGDSAPWDLHGICAAESEVETLVIWRDQQTQAHRLTTSQAAAVLQAIAVEYLEFDQSGLPASVRQDVTALAGAAGTLEHPAIDLKSSSVEAARADLHQVCADNGLTIGVSAQGG